MIWVRRKSSKKLIAAFDSEHTVIHVAESLIDSGIGTSDCEYQEREGGNLVMSFCDEVMHSRLTAIDQLEHSVASAAQEWHEVPDLDIREAWSAIHEAEKESCLEREDVF